MVTAAQRRRAVDHLSSRRACRLARFSCSAAWYRPKRRDDEVLRQRLRVLAECYPRYGDPTLHALPSSRGPGHQPQADLAPVLRSRAAGARTKRRKKLSRPKIPMAVPTRANERLSLGFVSDQVANGRRFRVLNVVDDFSRECVLQVVDLQATPRA